MMVDFEQLRSISSETEQIEKLYELFCEDARLNRSKAARVEFLTTVSYVERHLKKGSRILDIGAGTGEYSLYFASKGYEVSALELTNANLKVFQSKIEPDHPVDLKQGNALDLSDYADGSFDVVLLLGPLYHLHDAKDRARCIAEAKRVCKPDGVIFFAFISNDMVILTEFKYDQNYFMSGEYDHNTFKVHDFPFVIDTVESARAVLKNAGIVVESEVAADGMSELLADRINAMDDDSYAQYLRYHFYTCEKKELLGYSNHLLFIGR